VFLNEVNVIPPSVPTCIVLFCMPVAYRVRSMDVTTLLAISCHTEFCLYLQIYCQCRVVRVTKLTDSSSDDCIFSTLNISALNHT
jgi:hypothetical protein